MKTTIRFIYFLSICMLASACQEKNDDEKNSPPASPTLVAPSDAAGGVNTSPALVWACVDPDNDAVTYSIYLSANNPPDSLVISDLATAPYSITGLDYLKSYYWQVVAKDPEGAETKGPVWSFTTTANAGPDVPQTPGPDHQALDIPLAQRLSWWPSTDIEHDIVRYDVYLSEMNPPLALIADNLELPVFDITGLQSSKTYYWQVVARDNYGNATPGPVWQFSTLIDFRDGFVGTYKCMEIYSYFCPNGEEMNWCTDTVSFDYRISIEKLNVASLLVKMSESYSYEASYQEWNDTFECNDCPGPQDYVSFFGNDSIKSYMRSGPLNSYRFSGRKENPGKN